MQVATVALPVHLPISRASSEVGPQAHVVVPVQPPGDDAQHGVADRPRRERRDLSARPVVGEIRVLAPSGRGGSAPRPT